MPNQFERSTIIQYWDQHAYWNHLLERLKRDNSTPVFTNGCFDLLHVGHIQFLNKCKSLPWVLNPFLIVGLNRDESVREIKGLGRPLLSFNHRAYALASLRCVDAVVGFEELTPEGLLNESPSILVLVKGDEYNKDGERIYAVGTDIIEARGGIVVRIPRMKGISTTSIFSQSVILERMPTEEV